MLGFFFVSFKLQFSFCCGLSFVNVNCTCVCSIKLYWKKEKKKRGTLSNDDDHGSENVGEKENLSKYVHVLHETSHWEVQVVVVQWTSKKCTKKRNAPAEQLVFS